MDPVDDGLHRPHTSRASKNSSPGRQLRFHDPHGNWDGHKRSGQVVTHEDQLTAMLKLVLVGDANVGKTSLYDRFVDGSPPNHANEATIGVSFSKVFVSKEDLEREVPGWSENDILARDAYVVRENMLLVEEGNAELSTEYYTQKPPQTITTG